MEYQKIAREIKLSEATVRRAIRDLRKAGMVETNSGIAPKGERAVCCFS